MMTLMLVVIVVQLAGMAAAVGYFVRSVVQHGRRWEDAE